MNIEDIFRRAAEKNKRCILYDKFGNERMAEPYGIFITANGIRCFCVYQTEGYSESGDLPDWRNIPVEDCTDIKVTKEYFEIQSDYNPLNKTMYPEWICHI